MLLVLLLLVASSSALPQFVFCKEGIPTSQAQASPSDEFELWFLEAPVFEGAFGDLFSIVKGFHSAFGFRSKLNASNSFVVEYDAVYEVLNATLPKLETRADGSTELKWYNAGHNCIMRRSNWTYFEHKQTLVSNKVTATQFNSFLSWLHTDNVTYPVYELWNVMPKWESSASPMYINSSTCVDFNWRGFEELYRLGVEFDYSKKLSGDFINLYSSEPKLVNMSDPVQYKRVVEFYRSWHLSWNNILHWLEQLIFKHKYVYANGNYYELPSMHVPFLQNKYAYRPLPGQSQAE